MSVIMTLQVAGDPKALERYTSDNKDKMQAIVEAAKRHGLIAHRFYGSDDGRSIMVLDEWPDRRSFESFFQEQGGEIQPIFDAAGVATAPEPMVWTELATSDRYGWDA